MNCEKCKHWVFHERKHWVVSIKDDPCKKCEGSEFQLSPSAVKDCTSCDHGPRDGNKSPCDKCKGSNFEPKED